MISGRMIRFSLLAIFLLFASCSLLFRTASFKPKESLDKWFLQESPPDYYYHYYGGFYYCNIGSQDSLIVSIYKGGEPDNLLSVGPPLLPIIPRMPRWATATIDIDIYFIVHGGYAIDLTNIKFINKGYAMYPTNIGEIVNSSYDYRRHINEPGQNIATRELKDMVQNSMIVSSKSTYYRFYFDVLIDKVKDLEVHIEGLKINGVPIEVSPICFKTKTRLKYYPIFIN